VVPASIERRATCSQMKGETSSSSVPMNIEIGVVVVIFSSSRASFPQPG
jgi:hypothetical protein